MVACVHMDRLEFRCPKWFTQYIDEKERQDGDFFHISSPCHLSFIFHLTKHVDGDLYAEKQKPFLFSLNRVKHISISPV